MAPPKRIGSLSPDRARTLRHKPAEPERRLWQKLRNRQLGDLKFRRQTPVGPYVADFLCLDAMLIVEVDGDTHGTTQALDARRTAYLEREGFRVIRFSNAEVMANIDGVLVAVLAATLMPSPSQAPSGSGPTLSRGEREI
jgi:very-short-patch-repair endonuclease